MRSPPGRQRSPSRVKPEASTPFSGRLEVAADHHAVARVAEREREHAAGRGRGNRRGLDLPGQPAVTRVEHPRRAAAAREPGVAPAGDQARAAGGERELARDGRRHAAVRQHVPAAAAVVGRRDAELAVDRVAEREAATAALVEVHAVVERVRVVVDEREPPAAAAVGRAVDPRRVALADRHHARAAVALRLDVAEQQPGRVGRRDVLPRAAAVGRAQHLAVAASDPRGVAVDRVEPAVLLVGPGRDRLPARRLVVGERRRGQRERQDETQDDSPAHCKPPA